MSTNYYRIPSKEEMEKRHEDLTREIYHLDYNSPSNISCAFRNEKDGLDTVNPWEAFTKNIKVHLGKRNPGWVFCWNHNDWKYFGESKKDLFDFIRRGRVVNEYGEEIPVEEFIEMAEGWCQPDGMNNDKYYSEMSKKGVYLYHQNFRDIVVDNLRFMNYTNFK